MREINVVVVDLDEDHLKCRTVHPLEQSAELHLDRSITLVVVGLSLMVFHKTFMWLVLMLLIDG